MVYASLRTATKACRRIDRSILAQYLASCISIAERIASAEGRGEQSAGGIGRSVEKQMTEEDLDLPLSISATPIRHRLANAALLLGLVFMVAAISLTYQKVSDSAIAAQTPITFLSPLTPQEKEYAPGELVRFDVTRDITFSDDENQLLLVAFDSFQNVDTGESYPGAMVGRVVKRSDPLTITVVRQLPPKMTNGNYVLEGWAQAATAKRSMPASYVSLPFVVKNWE